ncbi:MAG: hypothetical protein A2902_04415 [Elusimicrobia bacterium RIFCSPLOWO2_01_FULL_64_13]|nr:MAG: hypothetical protein A2902_04415 [Elusimicrobia bacterium RIFCSPLOWO2_01_FULL_64_13]
MTGGLSRYFFYSGLAHASCLTFLVLASLSHPRTKLYYAVDFVGGFSSPRGGSAAPAGDEAAKVTTVNPEEDLLLKEKPGAKKDAKKKKEVVSKAPPVPSIPIPRAPEGTKGVQEGAGAIPGTESGIGIGFGEEGVGGTGGSGSGNFPYAWYVHSVRKKLDSNWSVPGKYGSRVNAQVGFTILKNGSLKGVEIEESSKDALFDRAALRAVEYSNPLPPLPSGFPESDLRVHVRFTVKN